MQCDRAREPNDVEPVEHHTVDVSTDKGETSHRSSCLGGSGHGENSVLVMLDQFICLSKY